MFNISTATAKNLRVSPRKLGLVAGLIRNLHVNNALVQLSFSKKRISKEVLKCLQSAVANAENNHGMDIDNLFVAEVLVGKSIVMKRFMPRARGRGYRIKKPFSNISIKLVEIRES
ncbi:MAG: 50S ribosomal protein L22 [Pseudomonadota bacterium]